MDINQAWKSTCKVLLGGEAGDVLEFDDYLSKYLPKIELKDSALSKKAVAVSTADFSPSARFISNDEAPAYSAAFAQKAKLGMNDIKDIDSITEALHENVMYAGNIVLGNSTFVQNSNRVMNSNCVANSADVYDSKYVADSSEVRYGENVFGSNMIGESKFLIRVLRAYKGVRCVEALHLENCSDLLYCANMEGCLDCMFSFNQRNKSRMIGNNLLPRDEYAKLKAKLASEMRQLLCDKKEMPSIIEIISNGDAKGGAKKQVGSFAPAQAPASVEKEFGNVTQVVLGKRLSGIGLYGSWLKRHVPELKKAKSSLSEKTVYLAALPYHDFVLERCVKREEADGMAERKLSRQELDGLSLANASKTLQGIKLFSPEAAFGQNAGMVECSIYTEAINCYYCSLCLYTKYSGYSYWPRQSEHVFGTSVVMSSQFCLKCYNSENISRCFEVSDSNNCTDCYFCHNCENVRDSMFCFNAKNLQYAIGNLVVGRERYLQVKAAVLAEIAAKLEKDKDFGPDIFNVGCAKR